jgi:starvation-inducible DNA-binding protein
MAHDNAPLTERLTDLLADTHRLMFKSQTVHWNATGPLFGPLHATTEVQYTEMFAAIDEMAERIRALGAPAPSSLEELMARAQIRDRYDVPAATEMIRELVADHRTLSVRTEELASAATTAGDSATADLAVRRRLFHDKAAWLLEAMLG